jgi:hypothetical protein
MTLQKTLNSESKPLENIENIEDLEVSARRREWGRLMVLREVFNDEKKETCGRVCDGTCARHVVAPAR